IVFDFVHRYLGDDEDESVSNRESRSKLLLAKLQQKAKEKERHREHLPRDQSHQPVVKKKRKTEKGNNDEPRISKKKKLEVTPTVSVTFDISDAVSHEEPAKEKKKKIKKDTKQEINDQSGLYTPVAGGDKQVNMAEEEEETKHNRTKQDTERISAQTGFTVLGGFENKPVQKVQRILPQWLAKPDVINRDIKSNLVPISEIQGISAQLVKKLENNGIQHFFPVQAEVIPAILESAHQGLLIGRGGYRPRDICVSAPTGSGKTLAFVIPVLQALMKRVVCEVRALAVLPTKELAQQVCKVFTTYAEGTTLKVVMLAGQKSFAAEQASLSEMRGGMRRSLADIVVTTPGRLVDHINKNSGLCLDQLRFLIIDEADRMIDSMHHFWLSQVTKSVYRSGSGPEAVSIFKRTEPAFVTAASLSPPQMPLQKLLFSATLTQNPEKLQQLGLYQPRLFSSVHSHANSPTCSQLSTSEPTSQTEDRYNFPEGLTEYYVHCTLTKKPLLVLHFVLRMKLSPILCFTNSREAAHRLFLLVQLFGGVQAAEFSSRLSPSERKRTLKDFEQGKIQLLISTDAAARGIDINGVKCVLNYDAPQYVRTYIHRIGRTARAGKSGLAFTFLLAVQEKNFLKMVAEAGSPGIRKHIVQPKNLRSMEAGYEQALLELATGEKVKLW
uniref:ATP-dependent RNA helicase n=1 Tax=Myripristis murdjan TaxID=586833 RepID=A0A667Y173_9TELE